MATQGSGHIDVEAGPADAGERMDRFVARAANISRQRAMDLIELGHVRVGYRRPKKSERVEAGAKIGIDLPAVETPVAQPELPLSLVHEDPLLLAFDKPAGLSMHPLESGETGTLANAVLARYPDVVGASPEERCPGLIHRLDRETSGVVLWARTRGAWESLRAQFAAKTVEKRYHALVDGFVEGAGELAVPLAHDPKSARRMVATPYPAEAEELKARPALTRYQSLGHGGGATLVEVEIPTGVMHQIRAHFAFVGYPVLGDALYGGRDVGTGERHLLHASSIGFDHPDGRGRTRLAAPIPADFLKILASFGIQPPRG
jgi:23S rRNA pseudouridine1911/1915/1917 synthase